MSLSVLRRPFLLSSLVRPLQSTKSTCLVIPRRTSHGFEIEPSSFLWKKMKDLAHFYLSLSFIFYGSIALLSNIFIGPAELAEIPEGYRPKHWEYYRHPISRFLQRYLYYDHQQEYEKFLAYLYEEHLIACLNALDDKVEQLIQSRMDYQAYVARPVTTDNANYNVEKYQTFKRYHGEIDEY